MNNISELPNYLPSNETSGHEPIIEHDYWLLDDLTLLSSNEVATNIVGDNVVTKYELTASEIDLISHLKISRFLEDGNSKDDFPLGVKDLIKVIKLLKKVKLSENELQMVLNQKISLHDVVSLHGLRTFEERMKQNNKDEARYRNREMIMRGESYLWDFYSGDYRVDNGYATKVVEDDEGIWDDLRAVPENLKIEDLLGEELTIEDIIRQSLEKNTDKFKPLMVLDIGGLTGLTWHRIANKFRQEIEEGKLVFIVTSLGTDVDWVMKQQWLLKDEEKDLILQTKDLVHHLKTDLASLLNAKIKVKNKEYSILGNVVLANDNNAVALHSLIPSVHLPMIASLLNEFGVYKTNVQSTYYAPKEEHFRVRDAELLRSFNILIDEFGMQHVPAAELGSTDSLVGKGLQHMFLRKPNGPKIKAFITPEQIARIENLKTK